MGVPIVREGLTQFTKRLSTHAPAIESGAAIQVTHKGRIFIPLLHEPSAIYGFSAATTEPVRLNGFSTPGAVIASVERAASEMAGRMVFIPLRENGSMVYLVDAEFERAARGFAPDRAPVFAKVAAPQPAPVQAAPENPYPAMESHKAVDWIEGALGKGGKVASIGFTMEGRACRAIVEPAPAALPGLADFKEMTHAFRRGLYPGELASKLKDLGTVKEHLRITREPPRYGFNNTLVIIPAESLSAARSAPDHYRNMKSAPPAPRASAPKGNNGASKRTSGAFAGASEPPPPPPPPSEAFNNEYALSGRLSKMMAAKTPARLDIIFADKRSERSYAAFVMSGGFPSSIESYGPEKSFGRLPTSHQISEFLGNDEGEDGALDRIAAGAWLTLNGGAGREEVSLILAAAEDAGDIAAAIEAAKPSNPEPHVKPVVASSYPERTF